MLRKLSMTPGMAAEFSIELLASAWIGFSQFEKGVEIGGCLPADVFRRQSADLAQLPGHFLYKYRLVAFAAVGHRRQEWRVGFDEHAFQRYFLGGVTDRLRLGKS